MGQLTTPNANTESLTVIDNRTGKSYSIPSDFTSPALGNCALKDSV